jgi:hypothetical protein
MLTKYGKSKVDSEGNENEWNGSIKDTEKTATMVAQYKLTQTMVDKGEYDVEMNEWNGMMAVAWHGI